MHTSVPSLFATQSCLVCTLFAKKSPMPLAALASHFPISLKSALRKLWSHDGVELADEVAAVAYGKLVTQEPLRHRRT